jgi:CubicO group peptidase (beta-lactamase class C family)
MNISNKKICIILLLLSLFFTSLYASDTPGARCGLNKKINSYLKDLAENKLLNGSVLVARDGKILYTRGIGMADFDDMVSNRPRTVFMVASLTKAFTAYSILFLEEQGLLSTSDTVDLYIPELPVGNQITIDQLLHQTAGVFEYLNNPDIWAVMDTFHYPSELLPYFEDQPLDFEPGSQFFYSNSNYILLGIIIERVSGMTFGDFINLNIIIPFHLKMTGYSPYEYYPRNMATGYEDITSNPPLESPHLSATIAYSAGGMYSNVIDLFKWCEGLFNNSCMKKKRGFHYLSQEGLDRLFTPGLGDYGYGWFVMDLPVNEQVYKVIFAPGEYLGYRGFIMRIVDENLTVIIEENHTTPTIEENFLLQISIILAGMVMDN